MNQYDQFLNVLQSMDQEGVEYVLVGGFAVILQGMPRHTMDIDLFVRLEEENIVRLRRALDAVFHDADILEITYSALQEYPVIRYGSPTGTVIDIMTKQGEVISYDDLRFQVLTVDGRRIRVATPETLLKMKQGSLRPGDQRDAAFCRRLAGEEQGHAG